MAGGQPLFSLFACADTNTCTVWGSDGAFELKSQPSVCFAIPRKSSHEDCPGLRLPGGDGMRLLGELLGGLGGPPSPHQAFEGCAPTPPFPQVKSWLRRAKSDDSEENAVGYHPVRIPPHMALALRGDVSITSVPRPSN